MATVAQAVTQARAEFESKKSRRVDAPETAPVAEAQPVEAAAVAA